MKVLQECIVDCKIHGGVGVGESQVTKMMKCTWENSGTLREMVTDEARKEPGSHWVDLSTEVPSM
jgi:hypothetical protein